MSEFKTLEEYQNSIKEFNAQSILGFEDFIINSNNDRAKLQLRCTPHTDKKCGYGCHDLDFGLSVWQHQQTKINELQRRIESAITDLTRPCYTQAGKIDDALKTLRGES